jgi:hypothetical protein
MSRDDRMSKIELGYEFENYIHFEIIFSIKLILFISFFILNILLSLLFYYVCLSA